MAGQLAVVAYRCHVAGKPSQKVDIQVRWFEGDDSESVLQQIKSEPSMSYLNADDEVVCWELSAVIAIEPFEPLKSGDEVIGFITTAKEIAKLR